MESIKSRINSASRRKQFPLTKPGKFDHATEKEDFTFVLSFLDAHLPRQMNHGRVSELSIKKPSRGKNARAV